MHWYVKKNQNKIKSVISKLKSHYKNVPVINGKGAKSIYSTYLHLAICWLEYDAIVELYGKTKADSIFKAKDHYKWIYNTVLKDKKQIGQILSDYGLIITPYRGISI